MTHSAKLGFAAFRLAIQAAVRIGGALARKGQAQPETCGVAVFARGGIFQRFFCFSAIKCMHCYLRKPSVALRKVESS
jgi:hypothetical protein